VEYGYRSQNKKKLNYFGIFIVVGTHTIPQHFWDVDLCGDRIPSSAFIRNTSQKAIASVAFHTKKFSWRSQIEQANWIRLLEKEIRWELADDSHDLNEGKLYFC
jgi:hypothetical protein